MAHNRYVMMGALCTFMLMRGAAEGGEGARLRTEYPASACFTVVPITAPGELHFYKTLFSEERSMGKPIALRAGIVSGPDQDLVEEVAHELSIMQLSIPGARGGDALEYRNTLLKSAIRKVIGKDLERIGKAKQIKLALINCTNQHLPTDILVPDELSPVVQDLNDYCECDDSSLEARLQTIQAYAKIYASKNSPSTHEAVALMPNRAIYAEYMYR